jgi:hypothetical protein
MAGLVVIGYDGSEDAQRARRRRAGVLAADAALVIDVWRGSLASATATAPAGAIAEQRDADLVVVGRRGMSRIAAVVLGSVSDAAVRDGRRAVLVVPAPD